MGTTVDIQTIRSRLGGCLFEKAPSPAPNLKLESRQLDFAPAVDLRPLCSPVEHQLTVQSCAGNAIVGALEYHRNRMKLPFQELSRLFVYYNARKLADRQHLDEGTYIHHVMAAVLAFGVCEERMWPYQPALKNEEPTRSCYSNATRYEAIEFARVDLSTTLLPALSIGLPVVFGAYFPAEFYDEAKMTAVMPNSEFNNDPGSGHAMLIVGYDANKGYFIVRNSWGAEFADGGYCYIPFQTMAAYSHPEHFWVIGKLSDHRGVTTNGPTVAESMRAVTSMASSQASVPQSREQAVSVLRNSSILREKLSGELSTAKKGFRDRLRGPGAGGGY